MMLIIESPIGDSSGACDATSRLRITLSGASAEESLWWTRSVDRRLTCADVATEHDDHCREDRGDAPQDDRDPRDENSDAGWVEPVGGLVCPVDKHEHARVCGEVLEDRQRHHQGSAAEGEHDQDTERGGLGSDQEGDAGTDDPERSPRGDRESKTGEQLGLGAGGIYILVARRAVGEPVSRAHSLTEADLQFYAFGSLVDVCSASYCCTAFRGPVLLAEVKCGLS